MSNLSIGSRSPRSPTGGSNQVLDPATADDPELARAKIAFINSLNLSKMSDFMKTYQTINKGQLKEDEDMQYYDQMRDMMKMPRPGQTALDISQMF